MEKEQLNLKLRLMLTPLLHKDVVESTGCPHQKAVSTFLPPAQREQRGIISNGVNLSAEFNATTGSIFLQNLLGHC